MPGARAPAGAARRQARRGCTAAARHAARAGGRAARRDAAGRAPPPRPRRRAAAPPVEEQPAAPAVEATAARRPSGAACRCSERRARAPQAARSFDTLMELLVGAAADRLSPSVLSLARVRCARAARRNSMIHSGGSRWPAPTAAEPVIGGGPRFESDAAPSVRAVRGAPAPRRPEAAFLVEETGSARASAARRRRRSRPPAPRARGERRDHQQRDGDQPRPGRSARRGRLPHGVRPVRPGRRSHPHRHQPRARRAAT